MNQTATPRTDAIFGSAVDCGTFYKIDRDDIETIRTLERENARLREALQCAIATAECFAVAVCTNAKGRDDNRALKRLLIAEASAALVQP